MSKHVVVVGGGVVGLATAYYLRREGAAVTVLERTTVGAGASWGNSGWVDPTFSAPLPGPGMVTTALRSLAQRNGSFYLSPRHLPRLAPWLWRFWRASSSVRHDSGMRATAKLALPAQQLYDDLVADGVRFETKRIGFLHAFLDARLAEHTRQSFLPLTELGYHLPDSIVDGETLREHEPALSESVAAGFVVRDQRVVYPSSLVEGLRARLVELGGNVIEDSAVDGFVTRGGTVTGMDTARGMVAADAIVLAAGVWTRQLAARLGIHVPLEAGKGYSFSVEPDRVPMHCLHLFEAKVAVSPFGGRMRLAGTMELSGLGTKLNRRRVAAVARSAQQYVTGWPDASLREEWMGMRPLTPDGLPVIGRPSAWHNVYLATGHGMVGVMLAPATGRAIAQLVLHGVELPELRPFSPDRFIRRRRREPDTKTTEASMNRATSAEQA